MTDTVHETSAAAIRQLQALGIEVVMITDDDPQTAAQVARQVGISRNSAEVSVKLRASREPRCEEKSTKKARLDAGPFQSE